MKIEALKALFGRRIKARRRVLGMTQYGLHTATGITTSFLSAVENGQANCSLNSAFAIAQALGLELGSMLSETDRECDLIELVQ